MEKGILNSETSIFQALKNLENTGLQIVLVVNNKKEYLGTLTDGDIRSGIIKGVGLNSAIKILVNKKSITVDENARYQDALILMEKKKINHIPVIKKNKIFGIFTRNQMPKSFGLIKQNIFLIMAGGRGKRLIPITNNTPKPLLIYKNKALIEHIIIKAKNDGFRNIYVSVNYLKNKIINQLKDGKKFGLKFNYIKEKKKTWDSRMSLSFKK